MAKGFVYLYGPFQQGGKHTSESNKNFDLSLRRKILAGV